MRFIQDIDRPDIDGVKPKMSAIQELAQQELTDIVPVLDVDCDDNLMSNVNIKGSFDLKATWKNSSFLNSRCFRFSITPQQEQQYYKKGEQVIVELNSKSLKISAGFRRSTTTPEKAVARIKAWVESVLAK